MTERLRARIAAALMTLLVLITLSCGGGNSELVLGATTSVQDSGLLDVLIQEFEGVTDFDVKPVVGGSGQTLETARRGEFDVILTHSPEDEDKFIADGEGLDKRLVMRNHFVIAGPEGDPALLREATGMADAFQRIASGGHNFISRGDNSGTHRREQELWQQLGVQPDGQPWYQVSSTGQGQNLLVASDRRAYTITDSATFTTFEDTVGLDALISDEERPNFYSVIRISPEKHPGVNASGAIAFSEFLSSTAGQCRIAEFGREKYGESLFRPALECPTSSVAR